MGYNRHKAYETQINEIINYTAMSRIWHRQYERRAKHHVGHIQKWWYMEAAGAVFLPAADIRTTAVFLDRSGIYRGYYWSANQTFMNAAGIVFFSNTYIIPVDRHSFTDGLSVRLVKDAN